MRVLEGRRRGVGMGRVLVTGASGYLGGRLCGALVQAGHSVVALVRKSSKVAELPREVELVEGDVRDADSVRRACVGCDYVLHTAALVGSWLPDSSQFLKVRPFSPLCFHLPHFSITR
jgi:farnesol dehydrogenase